jgi:hypothetical protein
MAVRITRPKKANGLYEDRTLVINHSRWLEDGSRSHCRIDEAEDVHRH